jgi:homocysteine S-methyltransferase
MAPASDASHLTALLVERGFAVLDGGLATELEQAGQDLDHPLWSARLVFEAPAAVVRVHRDYLEAGADCLTAASYQATIGGLVGAGLGRQQAEQVMRRTVELARQAWSEHLAATGGSQTPVVAASIGPYGAYLADGSEYVGRYRIDRSDLRAFHQPRWEIVSRVTDLLACETVPNLAEAEVLLDLLRQTPGVRAWVSFSCRDGERISDGTPIAECAAACAEHPRVLAVGVNCTAPRFVPELIDRVREAAPAKAVIAYPNSGETFDPQRRGWTGTSDPLDYAVAAREWHRRGASIVGGCCRTRPAHIRAIREALEAAVH